MKTFIFSYDPVSTSQIIKQIHAYIKDNKFVISWSKPFEGCYILKSASDTLVLYSILNQFFEGAVPFVLFEVEPARVSGLLNQEVWNWMNDRGLLGLLSPSGNS